MLSLRRNKLAICLSLCLLFCGSIQFLQSHTLAPEEPGLVRADYDWEETPATYELPESFKEEDAVILLKRKYVEVDAGTDRLVEHSVTHNRIYLNSDKAIEENNRVYIPLGENGVLVENKVRVINPDGKVETLSKDKILTGKDEDSGAEYKYYALEGLEIGSVLEYLYRQEKNPRLYGFIVYVEGKYPIEEFDYELICPRALEYKFKSYNKLSEPVEEVVEDTKTKWSINVKGVGKYVVEPMAHNDANKQYFIYKLHKNGFAGVADVNSFGIASGNYFDRVNSEISKGTRKALDKLASKIEVAKDADDRAKLLAIEQYVKTNFGYVDYSDRGLENLDLILSNKGYNDIGGLKLFTQLTKRFGLSPRIAITNNRADLRFDPDFETYLFLDTSLLYFPEIECVVDPTDNMSRLNHVNPFYLGNNALIIKEVKVGDFVTGMGKVGKLPEAELEENQVRLKAEVKIDGDFDEVDMDMHARATGLAVKGYQPLFDFIDADKMEEFQRYVMGMYEDKYIEESLSFENNASKYFGVEPFVSKYKLISDEFIEKGGNNYLFKIGMMIGPQSQMYYNEKLERRFEVVSTMAHEYFYTISFNIPENYKVSNLDDLKIAQDASTDEYKVFFFSDYKQEGNTVTVEVHESYDRASYPASFFKPFREVINTAADFNKITLIFEPK